jgi:hypothetical protein
VPGRTAIRSEQPSLPPFARVSSLRCGPRCPRRLSQDIHPGPSSFSRYRAVYGGSGYARPGLWRRGSGRRVAVSLIWVVERQQQPWESLCLNAYLMNRWSRSSIRVCLAGVVSTVGCRVEMTTNSRWRPSAIEWPQAWRIMRLTTCRPRPTLRRQEFPKQSIWRSEGCWATPPSTCRTADNAVLWFRRAAGFDQALLNSSRYLFGGPGRIKFLAALINCILTKPILWRLSLSPLYND